MSEIIKWLNITVHIIAIILVIPNVSDTNDVGIDVVNWYPCNGDVFALVFVLICVGCFLLFLSCGLQELCESSIFPHGLPNDGNNSNDPQQNGCVRWRDRSVPPTSKQARISSGCSKRTI